MYTDETTDSTYPKTVIVRNEIGGMVWQIYHVEKEEEASIINDNAHNNGFESVSLEDHQPELEQTWEDWRETADGRLREVIDS